MKKLLIITILALGIFLVACDADTSNESYQTAEAAIEETVDTPEDVADIQDEEAEEEPAVAEEPEEVQEDIVFNGFEQFVTIQLGTSLEEAEALLGAPTSTMTMDLLGTESTTNSWWTTNLFRLSTSETVTFTDGYATSVMGTADASSNITADDANQISNGMSESEVYEILGAPYSVMVMELMGTSSTTVSWINSDFSSFIVTFTNGNVSSTLASNLN